MPFKNEHSARLRDPREFKKFSRVNDRAGKGIDFVFGMKQGSSFIQAIRFDKKLFTVEQAKAWLKESGFPVIKFEPAKEGKSKMRKNPAKRNRSFVMYDELPQRHVNGSQVSFAKHDAMMETLTNDETSSDEELVNYIVKSFKVSHSDAVKLVKLRSKVIGRLFVSDGHGNYAEYVPKKNPADNLRPNDLLAWLTASYYEEEKGVKDYMRLLERIKDVPEYSGVRNIVKKIIKDEKKHLKMIARVLGA